MAWSISLVNLDQLAFFRLKRLLKGQCVAVTGDLMVIVIGWCCVRGMGSSTHLWHIEAILAIGRCVIRSLVTVCDVIRHYVWHHPSMGVIIRHCV